MNSIIMKRLSELESGSIAKICSFENNDLFLKLMEMGCVPGELVKVETSCYGSSHIYNPLQGLLRHSKPLQ